MRIFITHTLPNQEGISTGISIAATNFSNNLISGSAFDKVYSILPPFVTKNLKDKKNNKHEIIYFHKLRNTPLRKFAAILEQIRLFYKIPKGAKVWLYNMTPLNGILVKMLKAFKRSVKIYVIVLDFTPGEVSAERWLPTINSCDGRITLSMSERFNQKNTICLPGVTPSEKENWPSVHSFNREFIISGQLSDNISLLSLLLPIFANHPEWILNITGTAPELAIQYSNTHSNIKCHGKCSYREFLNILHKSPFLLSTRDPHMPENQCNFPSKIIEGLLHNRIIISTIDYPQLKPVTYIKIDAANLERDLIQVTRMDENTLYSFANQSELTFQMFNAKRWTHEMRKIEIDHEVI